MARNPDFVVMSSTLLVDIVKTVLTSQVCMLNDGG